MPKQGEEMEHKKCTKCLKVKDINSFTFDRRVPTGRVSICKECRNNNQNNYRRMNGITKGFIRKPKGYFKNSKERKIFYAYGLMNEDLEKMFKIQNYSCAICGRRDEDEKKEFKRRLVIDHCHKTGKVRSLLCNRCNVALGFIENRLYYIDQFMHYIIKHS